MTSAQDIQAPQNSNRALPLWVAPQLTIFRLLCWILLLRQFMTVCLRHIWSQRLPVFFPHRHLHRHAKTSLSTPCRLSSSSASHPLLSSPPCANTPSRSLDSVVSISPALGSALKDPPAIHALSSKSFTGPLSSPADSLQSPTRTSTRPCLISFPPPPPGK